jgi:hypothetical protein
VGDFDKEGVIGEHTGKQINKNKPRFGNLCVIIATGLADADGCVNTNVVVCQCALFYLGSAAHSAKIDGSALFTSCVFFKSHDNYSKAYMAFFFYFKRTQILHESTDFDKN